VTDSGLERLPFAQLLDVRITDVGEGRAVGRITLQKKHTSNPESGIAHGGVPYALADTVAGAAVSTLNDGVTPTIDMRIDYLQPSVGEYLEAEAEVVRNGRNVSTVDVDVRNDAAELVATARGTFKTSGSTGSSLWESGGGVGRDG
jgi:uncharacterized protein (TIGR00369 family)